MERVDSARRGVRVARLDDVIAWRFEVLKRTGYEPSDAVELAVRTDVDLHRAVDLVRNGCPTDVALQILL